MSNVSNTSDGSEVLASSKLKREERSADSEQQVSQRGRNYPRGETR